MQNENPKTAGQHQTMIVLWAALLMSQFIFLLLVFLIKPELFSFNLAKPLLGDDTLVVVIGIFALLAVSAVAASFFLRKQTVAKAIAEQNVAHVQSGLIIGCALCEASSLLGVMLAFAFDYPHFFLWIALGIIGTLLHFPKRSDIIAASYKKSEFSTE
jgi:F0F1-type ATP synthase membrane subunit c/vacuolar-type H+-ATPase subunit K